jgi:hypothetical protein
MGDDQDHGEFAGQHGAAGIGDIAAQAEEYLGDAGHDAGAVLADYRNGVMQGFWLIRHGFLPQCEYTPYLVITIRFHLQMFSGFGYSVGMSAQKGTAHEQ